MGLRWRWRWRAAALLLLAPRAGGLALTAPGGTPAGAGLGDAGRRACRTAALAFAGAASLLSGHTAAAAAEEVLGTAAAPPPAMYDRFAKDYDVLDGSQSLAANLFGIDGLRKAAISSCGGRVVEFAAGTGLNFPYYDAARVSKLTAIDISTGMLEEAQRKAEGLGFAVETARMDAARTTFADETFDTSVDTFSMCVFDDPVGVMREMGRVTKRGGRIVLLEHKRSDQPLLGAYQDLSAKPVQSMGKGCLYNQRLFDLAREAGLGDPVLRRDADGGVITLAVFSKD